MLAVQRKRVVPLMITCTTCPSRPLFAQTEEATPRYPLKDHVPLASLKTQCGGTYYGSPGGQTFAAISALPTLILGSEGSPSTHAAVRERVRPTPLHSAARSLGTWTVIHSAGESWEAWPRGNYTTKVDLLSGGHALAPRRKGPLKPLLPPRESNRAAPMHPSAQRNRVGGVASPHGSTAGAPATHGKHPRW